MNEPKIADTCPSKVELEAGKKYAYCTCGLSDSQPFCDGKHSGTQFKPDVFTAEKTESAWFCQCKLTENARRCDGTHKSISSE